MQPQQPTVSNLECLIQNYLSKLKELHSTINCRFMDHMPANIHNHTEAKEDLKYALTKQLFQTDPNIDIDMEQIKQPLHLFFKFHRFLHKKKGFEVPLVEFVFNKLDSEIFPEYARVHEEVFGEEQKSELQKIDEKIHQIYRYLVELWEEFRKFESWEHYQIFWVHNITHTIYPYPDGILPCYLGDIEKNRKRVHVFMDGQSGQIFFTLSFDSFEQFDSFFMAGQKSMMFTMDDKTTTYLVELMENFFKEHEFSKERQDLYMPEILSCAESFKEIAGKPCLSPCQTDKENHEKVQKRDWDMMKLNLQHLFFSMISN